MKNCPLDIWMAPKTWGFKNMFLNKFRRRGQKQNLKKYILQVLQESLGELPMKLFTL